MDIKKIGICICTYKREKYLKLTLRQIKNIHKPNNTYFEIFIVDNDKLHSAKHIIDFFTKKTTIPIHYYTEPSQNIAKARNKVIKYALQKNCDFLALIDDDELPSLTWITDLYGYIINHDCNGVLGPVVPFFNYTPPTWVKKSNYLVRKFQYDGEVLSWPQTRTGNVLLKATIFKNITSPFDTNFGTSGGEDLDFFKRMIEKNFIFLGINKGAVYEHVPKKRISFSYIVRRSFIQGWTNIKLMRKYENITFFHFLKSLLAIIFYLFGFIFFIFKGYTGLIKTVSGFSFHTGRFFSFFMINKKISRKEFQSQ